ncbi:MAG: universal stress protein [Acidimicrobiales bacterium]
MISTIVVGTDGSRTAQRAVAVAADLARRLDATVHLVHGYQAPVSLEGAGAAVAGPASTTSSMWQEMSEAVLDEAVADPSLEGVRIERHSVAGGAWQGVVSVAEEVGADLVVVGNRGMRGTGDSVPDAVAVHAPCHVLIAKTT